MSLKKRIYNTTFILVVLFSHLLLLRCANVTSPQGGPKDTIPPKLINSFPKNKQTLVKGNDVWLIFDSNVNTDNLENELIVTPVMEKKYKLTSTNKQVKLKFNEPLKENSTYTLTFRKGITDETENNPARNLKLVFSTGDKLDSFQIHGTISKLITKSPVSGAVIAFYKTDQDTINEKTIPIYQSISEPTGEYMIENIKDENYLIYAYSDINKNYKYDQETELLSKQTYTKNTENHVDLQLFLQDKSRNRKSEIEQKTKSLTIDFTKNIEQVSIKSLKDSTTFFHKVGGKKIELWPEVKADTTADTLKLQLTVKDSSNAISLDTILYKYKYNLDSKNLPVSFYQNKYNQTTQPVYIIEANNPIQTIRANDIEIRIDKKKFSLSEMKYQLSDNRTQIKINIPSQPKDSIKVKILPQTIFSIYNDTNTLYTNLIQFAEQDSKGILSGTVKCSFKNYILEILNENYSVKESFYSQPKFKITNLEPANYIIRLIEDRNENEKWDFKTDTDPEPEKIVYFKEKIIMKANWEINDVLITD